MSAAPADGSDTSMTTRSVPPPSSGWARYGEVLVAVGVIAMGIVILIETRDIRVPPAYASVGPRVMPTIIGWGLIVVGAWYAIGVMRGDTAAPSADSEDVDPTLPPDWAVLGGLALALGVYAVLMEPAGFVIASAILFLMASFSMGSRQIARDAAIGAAAALVTYLVFSEWLGIRLPAGLLEPIFG